MLRTLTLASLVVVLLAPGVRARQRDLREDYGTKSLEAAQSIKQGLDLQQAKKPKEALEAFDKAITLDDGCPFAYFQKAIVLNDLGNVEEAMEAYKKCLSDSVRPSRFISALAAVNLGLTLAKLNENDQANVWLSRGIVEDWNNGFKQRGKAYRNLAVSLKAQGKHLAAALAIALAFDDKAPNCDLRLVMKFFDEAEGSEAARLLHFPEKAPTLAKRTTDTRLTPVTLEKGPAEQVTDLLSDPEGRYLVALVNNAEHYYVIGTGDKPAVSEVAVAKPVKAGCLAEGHLFVACADPARIDKLEVATGKVVASYPLKAAVPSSLAVFPTQGRAYFCADDVVLEMDLKTSNLVKTKVPGQVVAGHPGQRYLYSYIKPERRGGGGRMIIEGRTIYFNRGFNWLQSTLFKSVVVPRGLLLAEVRDNVCSNAARMGLSPDGNWVAVAGGGGWRPTIKGDTGGYGIAVFSAHNFEHRQGFFKTDAYPTGVAFNPVTAQAAMVRGKDVSVYHLSDPKSPTVLDGPFTGVSAWSGNGRYLALAKPTSGIALYENALSTDEQKVAGAWFKEIKPVPVVAAVVPTATFKEVEEYKTFALAAPAREDLARALAKAVEKGQTDRPGRWQEYAPYTADAAIRQAIDAAAPKLASKDDRGIALYQLKKAFDKHPDSPPLQFFLAEAQRLQDQPDKAEANFLAVVKADAGRTDLSWRSLNQLAAIQLAQKEEAKALNCLAASLFLDKANPQTLRKLLPLLRKEKFDKEAEQLAKLASTLPAAGSTELPALAVPAEGKKLSSKEIYQKAVWSVVLIKTSKGSGSGVCVGKKDIILTNHHVVDGGGDVEVYTYILKDNAPVRMPVVHGTIIYQSEKQDVAVLRLDKAPDHLEPMPVAADLNPGDKVYAVGSPGLGTDVLELSISEGLVSSKRRMIQEVPYLQHSAAVNPGNSGGPLLDESGRVAGIVTLKARLENVSFAIPVETIRAIFKGK